MILFTHFGFPFMYSLIFCIILYFLYKRLTLNQLNSTVCPEILFLSSIGTPSNLMLNRCFDIYSACEMKLLFNFFLEEIKYPFSITDTERYP